MNNDNQYYYNLLKGKNTYKNIAIIITIIYNFLLIISAFLFSGTFGWLFMAAGEKEMVDNLMNDAVISLIVCIGTMLLWIKSKSNLKKRKYDPKIDYLSSACILGTIIMSKFLLDMPILLVGILILLSCIDLYNIYDINKKIRDNNINMKTHIMFPNTIVRYSNIICHNCNSVNNGTSNYCAYCGNRIK